MMKVKNINAGGTIYEVSFNEVGKVIKVVAPPPDGEIRVSVCHPKVIALFEAAYAN